MIIPQESVDAPRGTIVGQKYQRARKENAPLQVRVTFQP
jgi:hypothetical protein